MEQPADDRGFLRRHWLPITASALVVVVALGVLANVVLTGYVKDGVVQALRCATGDDSITPSVSLGPTPVLVDLASREVDEITIGGLSSSALDSGGLDGDLSLTLHGVGLGDPPKVRSAAASLRLGWDVVGSTLAASADELEGAELAEEDGLLALTLPGQVGGEPLKVLVGLRPEGGSMTVTPEAVVIRGRRVGTKLAALLGGDLVKDENGRSRLESRTVDLHLPEGAALETVQVQADGLALGLSIDPALVRGNSAPAGPACWA